MKHKERRSLYVTRELHVKINQVAALKKKSINDFVSELLEREVNKILQSRLPVELEHRPKNKND
jgi:uncharacterized protein (DUF1778 family)